MSIRVMTLADMAFADSLRALAGWNQTIDDWKRFLAIEPEGCFVADCDGALAGTATTIRYGTAVGWIGMLLVHPDFRRRGIGRALLQRCIDFLRDNNVQCVKLDATPLGKKVYDALEFKDEWTLTRYRGSSQTPNNHTLRTIQPPDLEAAISLDAQFFGAERGALLKCLFRQGGGALATEQNDAFGFIRNGSNASYLGPISATNAESGLAVAEALIASTGGKIIWDIPDENIAARDYAIAHDFVAERSLTRMYLGKNVPSSPLQFAIAGPEVG